MYKKYKSVLVSGCAGSGKTTFLKKYIDYMLSEDDVHLVIVDPKQVELFEYKNKEKVIYIAENFEHMVLEVLKPIIENRMVEEYPKAVIIVDEFAELTFNKDCLKFFEYMFVNKEKLNLELVLTSQLDTSFNEKYIDYVDVTIKLNR